MPEVSRKSEEILKAAEHGSLTKNPLRIAVYHNLEAGGAKRHLVDMLKCLMRKGHRLDLYTLNTSMEDGLRYDEFVYKIFGYELKYFKHITLPIYSLELVANFFRQFIFLGKLKRISKRIAADINEQNYDLIYVHHCIYTQSPIVLRFLKGLTVYCCHEGLRWSYEKGLSRNKMVGKKGQIAAMVRSAFEPLHDWIMKRTDQVNVFSATKVLSNSFFSRETLHRIYGIFSDVAYPGIDIEKFKPADIAKEDFVFAPGRVEFKKGYEWLIRALGRISKSKRPRLVMGGYLSHRRKPEIDLLTELARKEQVSLQFVDLSTDEKMVHYYCRAKITAYLPYLEPFGLIPVESMACGTPVVGIKEGGVRETILDGEVGLLVDHDVDEIANAILTLFEDENLREQMGIKARKYAVEKWNKDSKGEQLEQYFYKIVDQRGVLRHEPDKEQHVTVWKRLRFILRVLLKDTPRNIVRRIFLIFWSFKIRREFLADEVYFKREEKNNPSEKHVEIILVDWVGYPIYRTKRFGDFTATCGLGPLAENMALAKAGLSFSVTLIINGADEAQRNAFESWKGNYPFIKRIIFHNNQGKDLGAYNAGYQLLKGEGYLGDVLFVNSSSRGPLRDYWLLHYWRLFRSAEKVGLCGISMNSHTTHLSERSFQPHLQSFFLYSNMKILMDVFPENLPGASMELPDRLRLISEGEIKISQKMLEADYGIVANFSRKFIYYHGKKWRAPSGDLRFREPYRVIANQI